MLPKASGLGQRVAHSYEVLLRKRIINDLSSLQHGHAEQAWTTHISSEDATAIAQRVSDEAANTFNNLRPRTQSLNRRFLHDQLLFKSIGGTVAIKDNIITTNLPNSAASNILRGYVAPQKATIVRLMEDAGLTILGKTNMDEFGMGSHSRHSAFGPMQNLSPDHLSVGGSSGGSAFLVARALAQFAVGTDTGGSVRLPASYLNIVGFKPSYGRISRYGVVPYANSLDTVGLFARDCNALFSLFNILDKPDDKDPTCLSAATRQRGIRYADQQRHRERPPNGLIPSKSVSSQAMRIGVPSEYNIAEMQNGVREALVRALNLLEAKGHKIVPISLPSTQQALSAYYVLAPAEASSNLAKYDGVRYGSPRTEAAADGEGVLYSAHRGAHFGEEVKRRILLGAYSLSAGAMDNFFIQAQKVRRLVQTDFNRVFRQPHSLLPDPQPAKSGVDFIVCPTAPTFPPRVDSLDDASALEAYTNDVFTVPASLAGLPAISVPAPQHVDTLRPRPERAVGIQIIAQHGYDWDLLNFALFNFQLTQDWSRFHNDHRALIK